MARAILPLAGAVVGSFFGAPQLGYAIGSIVGNAVDPQRIKGPRVGDANLQTSQEGAPRPIVYGKAAVMGNLIDRGPLNKVITEERQGKGGPVVETESLYMTFAIRICEGPIESVSRIWEDERLVYDVRPESAILDDSLNYAQGFTLYLGSEDQLPDPDLEVIHGIGNTPAHRGTAYIVFTEKNLTDRRGSIPQFRFEVNGCLAALAPPNLPDDIELISSTRQALSGGSTATIPIPGYWEEGDDIIAFIVSSQIAVGSSSFDLPLARYSSSVELSYAGGAFGTTYLRVQITPYNLDAASVAAGAIPVIGITDDQNVIWQFIRLKRGVVRWPLNAVGFGGTLTESTTNNATGPVSLVLSDPAGLPVVPGSETLRVVVGAVNNRASISTDLSGTRDVRSVVGSSATNQIASFLDFDVLGPVSTADAGTITAPGVNVASPWYSIFGAALLLTLQRSSTWLIPASFTQSSVAAGCSAATVASMTDNLLTTGTRTASGPNEWIQADLGVPRYVARIGLRTANVSGIDAEANGAVIQSSVDGVSWTTEFTISGVNVGSGYTGNSFEVGKTARYWRMFANGTTADWGVAEFRFFSE